MKATTVLLLLLATIALAAQPVIASPERAVINRLMTANGIDSTSVDFLKDWSPDTRLKLPLAVDILNHPWRFADYLGESESRLRSMELDGALAHFAKDLYGVDVCRCGQPLDIPELKRPGQVFDYVENLFESAGEARQRAFANLSADEIAQLRYLASTLWQEAEDSTRYRLWREEQKIVEPEETDLQKLTPVIGKIDFPALMESALILREGVQAILYALSEHPLDNRKSVVRDTRWGRFAIGSPDNDVHDRPCAFLLDPGGNDVYTADWSAGFDAPFYLLIDLKGDDVYRNDRISGLFSVLGGVGINCDLAGNDAYLGGDNAMSAFLGVQVSEDSDGDDIYRAGLYGLAAGTFGISVLSDRHGRDEYYVLEYGEGFGGTLGAGILSDNEGNDLYFAGGKYLHVPLAPNDYRSMSQGFGFGLRPEWGGGVGIIYDGSGNDTYKGGVYSQAVAYWYALGMIIDESGNDVYDSVYYPQGSGIHLAGGFLFDREGDDHYYSKNGPGQGAAHDWAVGFLVDRAGNDIYSVPGGNGLALTNSVAVFLDVSGDDRYERSARSNYGYANQSRDSGGLGFFADLGGSDRYPAPDDTTRTFDFWRDNHTWTSDTYGFGIDTLMVVPEITPMQALNVEAAADVDSTAAIDSLFAIASSWGVGSFEQRVRKAQGYLLGRQGETARYIYENKLGSKDGLVWRAIAEFAHKSDSLRHYIPAALNHPDSLWNKGAIALIAELADSTFTDSLRVFLDRGRYVPAILSALGDIPGDRGTEVLEAWMNNPSERYRVIVARGFKNIGTPRAREDLGRMSGDPSFTVRTIALLGLRQAPGK